MNIKKSLGIFIVGTALFSMFFGGGNLAFPLWIGIQTSSVFPTIFGFLISGVMLPFYGVIIGMHFRGDYQKYLNIWGKTIGAILIFALLVFWIPLGSAPRCNQLAYGAFCQMQWSLPLWAYSALYSCVVFLLTYKKSRILEILGNYMTPLLLLSLFFFIFLGLKNFDFSLASDKSVSWSEFYPAFSAGYNTMDFIAAIFFTSAIISLIKEKQKESFHFNSVLYSFLIGIALLSVIYIGMIIVGKVNADILQNVTRDQLLAALGRSMFHETYHSLIFIIITLSCLTTSIALALVFSDYLRETIFKNKLGHKACLGIAIFISFIISTMGFEHLAVLISYAMSMLYPFLVVITTAALISSLYKSYRTKADDRKAEELIK